VAAYIHATIHAYISGLESAESIKLIKVDKEVACKGPPSLDDLNYITHCYTKTNYSWPELSKYMCAKPNNVLLLDKARYSVSNKLCSLV
jgi:hypothetical protein